MKTKKLLLTVLLVTMPLLIFAQEWDDIYADPSRNETVTVQKKNDSEPQKKRVVIVQGDVSNMEVVANGRDLDEYNRRGNSDDSLQDQSDEQLNDYQEYEYTDRIVRFHEPESSIRITGADEVIVYVGDDLYEGYNNRGWNNNFYYGAGWGSFYPWYDPWYYGGWYSPWSYSRWYNPWHYGYGGMYGGWNRWHSPWNYGYGGWYDPFYYGGYYGGYYGYGYGGYGYGGGYGHGFYDGYYSSLTSNRSGRSSGTYRTSSANRTASSAALSGRSATGRTSTSGTRNAITGRTSTSDTRSAISG